MKPGRVFGIAGLMLVLMALSVSSIVPRSASQAPIDAAPLAVATVFEPAAYQLLANAGMEIYDPPYTQFEGIDCQVATGWQRFWYGAPEPYWMDTRVFADSYLGSGWVERIEGETSQLIITTEPYIAGLQQQVSGLTPGTGYGFHAAMLTIFQTSAPPAQDGTMVKQVGMDPSGGTDPQAPTVVWSEADDHDEGPWSIDLRTAVYAETPTMTVFVRVESPYESGGLPYLNYSFLDSAILAETPVVTATSPAFSEVPTFTVNWDNAVPAPGGNLRWHDVQWRDEWEAVWHDWITGTDDVEAIFGGEWGHTYHFRARVWQRYANGAHLYGPYRAAGDTTTVVHGARLVGSVLNNEGDPVAGATVAISDTVYATTSGYDGGYRLAAPPMPGPQAVVVSHPTWLAPAPVYSVTLGLTDTVTLTWTLRPPDDATVNGEFEAGLDGWSLIVFEEVSPTIGVTPTVLLTPTVVTEPVHTGRSALALGGAPPVSQPVSVPLTLGGVPPRRLPVTSPVSFTLGVTQTVVVTGAWEPVLSFWYRPVTTDTDDVFNVILTVVTQTLSPTVPITPTGRSVAPTQKSVAPIAGATLPLIGLITPTLTVTVTHIFTPSLDVEGWHHLWYYLGPPEVFLTGTATIRFQVWQDGDKAATTVYLDEVSLGSTPREPDRYGIYLPVVLKQR